MHDEREASVRAQRATGTALMLVKHHVVEEAFRETEVRLVSMSAIGPTVITKSYRDGMEAGDRVNLSRPVTGCKIACNFDPLRGRFRVQFRPL
jgi:hypothetical protein